MRVAIVGAGRMGVRHMEAVSGMELVGIADISSEALQSTAAQYSLPVNCLFQDAHAMLAQTAPELVIVATTAPTHCEFTCAAAKAGASYILVEKPMAPSLAQCDEMIETCRRNKVRLAVNHPMRFMDQYTRAKEILNSAEFGGLLSVSVIAGNCGIAMNGTHYFEMFRYLTDEIPISVSARYSDEKIPNPRGAQFEDWAGELRVVSPSGKRLILQMNPDHGHGLTCVYSGPYGQLIVDSLEGIMTLSVRKEEFRGLPTTRYAAPWLRKEIKIEPTSVVGPTRRMIQALIDDEDYMTGEQGRNPVAVLTAAFLSNQASCSDVEIGDDLNAMGLAFPIA